MGKRFVPDLTFHIDRSEKMKARIDQLLGRKRQARLRAQNSGSDGGSASPQQEKTQDPGK
jgi:ribosome-binding factor A